MTDVLTMKHNCADQSRIAAHLRVCDAAFAPPLSLRVDIDCYAQKIVDNAQRFERWHDGELVALVAAYGGAPPDNRAFITNVSVVPAWQGRKVGSHLIDQCIATLREDGVERIALEVAGDNIVAMALYQSKGFVICHSTAQSVTMELELNAF